MWSVCYLLGCSQSLCSQTGRSYWCCNSDPAPSAGQTRSYGPSSPRYGPRSGVNTNHNHRLETSKHNQSDNIWKSMPRNEMSMSKCIRSESLYTILCTNSKELCIMWKIYTTSLQISRCFSAKCMAWSWFPKAVCAFPKLQHARPSPILQEQKHTLIESKYTNSKTMLV